VGIGTSCHQANVRRRPECALAEREDARIAGGDEFLGARPEDADDGFAVAASGGRDERIGASLRAGEALLRLRQ